MGQARPSRADHGCVKHPNLREGPCLPCHRASLRPSWTSVSPFPAPPRSPHSRSPRVTASRCSRRWVGYPIVAMVTVVVCAMLAGARSYAAIGQWCADLDATDRRDLGFTGKVPGPVTIWRLLVRVDAVALDEVVCAWIRACLTRVDAAARARS